MHSFKIFASVHASVHAAHLQRFCDCVLHGCGTDLTNSSVQTPARVLRAISEAVLPTVYFSRDRIFP